MSDVKVVWNIFFHLLRSEDYFFGEEFRSVELNYKQLYKNGNGLAPISAELITHFDVMFTIWVNCLYYVRVKICHQDTDRHMYLPGIKPAAS